MYPVKIPAIIKPFAKDLLWSVDTKEKILYLTFDDGPIPGVTDKVLDTLKEHNAKATFFCLGRNVELHQDLFERLIDEGHTVGNHSYNHPDGWKTPLITYTKNALQTDKIFKATFFRPPYGRITMAQSAMLKKRFRIVMWHVISGDFDQSISKEKCLENVLNNSEKGSIVVFHDSLKASPNMHYALEGTLKHFAELGYRFDVLPQ